MICPRVIANVPVYNAVTPTPFMHFLLFSQETGKAEAAGKYKVKWNVGGPQTSVAIIRNAACEFAKIGDATHLLLIDDDMLPQSNILEHLLSLDLPIVAPIFFKDCGDPLVFDWDPESGQREPMIMYPVDQVFEAPAGVGTGVMLIKREVIDALEKPWFGYGPQSDLEFCGRAADKGFKSYCDSRVLVQQMGKASPTGKTPWEERKSYV
jgi:hypothetical protein